MFELCKYSKWFKSYEGLKSQNLVFKIDMILHKITSNHRLIYNKTFSNFFTISLILEQFW